MIFQRNRIGATLPVVPVLKGLAPSSGLHRHLHTLNKPPFKTFFLKALVHFATNILNIKSLVKVSFLELFPLFTKIIKLDFPPLL